ncbi:MAG: Calx-beta domain-containing protein, partial [Pseudomonadota bacterium]
MPIVSIVRGESDENGNVVFIITLSEAASDVVTLQYRTQRDSSANDDDIFYDALDSRSYNTLTYAPGETQKTVSVFARSDNLDEVDEFFSLELFNLSANAEFAGGE